MTFIIRCTLAAFFPSFANPVVVLFFALEQVAIKSGSQVGNSVNMKECAHNANVQSNANKYVQNVIRADRGGGGWWKYKSEAQHRINSKKAPNGIILLLWVVFYFVLWAFVVVYRLAAQ